MKTWSIKQIVCNYTDDEGSICETEMLGES